MTKQLVEFELDDGSTVVFETDAPVPNKSTKGGVKLVANDSDDSRPIHKAEQKLNALAGKIKPAAQIVLDALRELNTPKQIQLAFGIKLDASTGVIFANAGSEVNFNVTVTWENPDTSDTPNAKKTP